PRRRRVAVRAGVPRGAGPRRQLGAGQHPRVRHLRRRAPGRGGQGAGRVQAELRDLRRQPARRPRGVQGAGRGRGRAGADRPAEAGLTMPATTRQLNARRKSVTTIRKVTRAMELIAASRIVKAQQRAQAAGPYSRELTRAVSAVATYSNVDHPLTTEKPDPSRAAMLLITSDRGLAGAYSSSVIREGERLTQLLREEG